MKEFKESLFDLVLTYASKELVDEIVSKYPEPEELKGKYEFSPEFEKWAEEFIRKDKRRKHSKKHKSAWNMVLIIIKRAAVTICIMLSVFSLMAFAIPSIRIALANYFIEQNDKYISMELQEDNKEKNSNSNYSDIIPYLPEGFVITKEIDNDNLLVIQYMNDNNETIQFERYTGTALLTIDNEESGFEQIMINNNICYISVKNGSNTIVFNNENYGYMISSEINMDELKKMAESILK